MTAHTPRAEYDAKLVPVKSRDQLMLVPIRHWTVHDRIALARILEPWGLEIVDVPARVRGTNPLFKIVAKK